MSTRSVVVFAATLAASAVMAASPQEWDDCDSYKVDRAIVACTRILQGPNEPAESRVAALFRRGVIYADQDDHDRAIADYGEVIRLAPDNSNAYFNRGYSYARKGSHGDRRLQTHLA